MGEAKRLLKVMVVSNVMAIAAVIALAVYVFLQLQHTNTSLCSFRGDLEQRVDQTQKFLDDHPGPEPFPGITRATLQTGLTNQRRTIESLSDLNC